MQRKLVSLLGASLTAAVLSVPVPAYGFGGTLFVWKGSVRCDNQITGGTRQTVKDGAASCSIQIKEITTVCVNRAGNADNSSSHIFRPDNTIIQETVPGRDWRIAKNGSTLAEIEFTEEEIAAATGVNLDPATLCPNKNWRLVWAVTRFDLVATVHTVYEGWLPHFPDPSKAFDSCNPSVSGLTYAHMTGQTHDDPSSRGILDECWLFRNESRFVDQFFDGTDRGGVAYLHPDLSASAYYNGVCQEHGKQNGSLQNIGAYNRLGPNYDNPSADPECTGGNVVLNGQY